MGYKRYRAIFQPPIPLKNTPISQKDGYYLFCDENCNNLSELPLLPGYTQTSIQELDLKLGSLSLDFIHPLIKQEKRGLFYDFSKHLIKLNLNYPEIRFALSMLTNKAHHNLSKDPKKCKIQILYQPNSENQNEIHPTTEVIKIKANKYFNFSYIEGILKDTNAQIRVDANQSWKLSEALEFAKRIPKDRIDYFEEPLQNPNELELFYSKSGVPYALDENIDIFKNRKLKGLRAIILKPSLIGSYLDIIELIRSYRTYNEKIKTILSSSYETSIGLNYIKQLALHIAPEESHGLDTEKYINRVEYAND